jgi:mannose-6-phosphate isomerase-like protein (cupin superfamily)
MSTLTLDAFKAKAQADGCDELLERVWAPNTVVSTHTHPFDAQAMVTHGEFWLTCDGHTQHLRPGDTFALGSHVPHEERYGPEGATFWVARKHAA